MSHTIRTHFDAPWDTPLRVLTLAASAVLLGQTVRKVRKYRRTREKRALVEAGVSGALLAGSVALSVRGYRVGDGTLVVERLAGVLRAFRSLASNVSEARPGLMSGSLRALGNGGLFSYLGWFWNETLGLYRPFATHGGNTVALHLPTRTIVVTPDHPAAFVQAVEAQAARAFRAA